MSFGATIVSSRLAVPAPGRLEVLFKIWLAEYERNKARRRSKNTAKVTLRETRCAQAPELLHSAQVGRYPFSPLGLKVLPLGRGPRPDFLTVFF